MTIEFSPHDAIVQNEAQAKSKVLEQTKLNIDFVPVLLSFYNNYDDDDFEIAFAWKSIHLENAEMLLFAFEEDIKLTHIYENYDCIPLSQESTFITKDRIFTIKHSNKGYELMELPYLYSEREVKSAAKLIDANPDLKWDICLGYINKEAACFVWVGKSPISGIEDLYLPVFGSDNEIVEEIDCVGIINKNKPIINAGFIYEIKKTKTEGLIINKICNAPITDLSS